MTKCLCDFCKKNDADYSYTVFEKSLFTLIFQQSEKRADICRECYQKLFERKEGSEGNETD